MGNTSSGAIRFGKFINESICDDLLKSNDHLQNWYPLTTAYNANPIVTIKHLKGRFGGNNVCGLCVR